MTARGRGARGTQLGLGLPTGTGVPTVLSRATARVRRSGEQPAPRPWLCTLLAIDTARISGWALYVEGELQAFGEIDTLVDEPEIDRVVRLAVDTAAGGTPPLVLVLESPWGGSVDVVAALGAARERWLRAWRQCEQPLGRVLRVRPSTWRAGVLGSRSIGLGRDSVRALELRIARAVAQVEFDGHDAAAAILIGRWATHARAVGRAIGSRAARASLRAWTGQRGKGAS